MAQMTDPTPALKSFQHHLRLGNLLPQPGELDRQIHVHLDDANGKPRFTYVTLDRQTVTALVMLVFVDRKDGAPCFQIGYAVPPAYRRQGLAQKAVHAAIAELRHGLARTGVTRLSIEAVVGLDSVASQHVAAATLSAKPTQITDSVSGLPALYYCRSF